MNTRFPISRGAAALVLLASLCTGCDTTDGGSSTTAVYYGTGFYDPWYYGGYYSDVDIDVSPPPRPTHPIERPPVAGPRPTPMPSIPSRPMPRRR